MPDEPSEDWKSDELDPLRLLLDTENPRIDADDESTQEAIREKLLKYGQVVELAKKINNYGGLVPAEQIIVVKVGRKYVVLEGNRRTCAIQLLLSPTLVPPAFKARFPPVADGAKKALKLVRVEIAPSREAADHVITLRHTSIGALRWSPTAQHRRLRRLLAHKRSIEDIAAQFGLSKGKVRRFLEASGLLEFVYDLGVWNKAEEDALNQPDIQTNPFTRFFQLRGVTTALGISFDSEWAVTSTLGAKQFKKAMEQIARQLLLPPPKGKKRSANTRTTPEELFRKIAAQDALLRGMPDLLDRALRPHDHSSADDKGETSNATANRTGRSSAPGPTTTGASAGKAASNAQSPANGGEGGKVNPKPPRNAKFFETLHCTVNDEMLARLARELTEINYARLTYAATYLTRAIMEKALERCVHESDNRGKLIAAFTSNGGQVKGGLPEPGLRFVLSFCIKNHDAIFAQNVRRILESWQDSHKDYCDIVVHANLTAANPALLEQIASVSRPFIQRVLDGTIALQPKAKP